MIRSPAGALSRWKFIPALPVLILTMVVASDARAPGARATRATASPARRARRAAPLGTIPANIKALKTQAELKQHLPAIEGIINAAVANLAGPNTALQTRARTTLINETLVNGLPQATPSYLDAYAQALNAQLLPLANHQSPRVRLNAAIIAAEVAAIAKNIHLAPTAQAFLNDKSDAVVLWAMKAARFIIPAQLKFPGQFNKALADAIVPTVVKHSTGQVAGAIALEAYAALSIDVWAGAAQPAHINSMVPYMLDLLNERLKLYVKGVPPSPRAEQTGTSFLTWPKVWPLLNQQQQLAAMQVMVNVIVLAGQQAQPANPGDRFELTQTIQRAASGISTVAPAAAPALKLATELNPQNATPQQIAAAVQPILPAIQAVPQFKALANPPAIQGNEPAPPPASAPTTGTVLLPGASTQPTTTAPPPGVGVPPGTTPAAPGAAPKGPPGAKPDGARPPGGPQSPRPTQPGGASADPKTPANPGAGTGAGAGGGTTPPKPAR